MGVVKIPVDNDDDDRCVKTITAIQSNYVIALTVSPTQMLVLAGFINHCSKIEIRLH